MQVLIKTFDVSAADVPSGKLMQHYSLVFMIL